MPTLYIRNAENTDWVEIGGTPGGGSPPSDLYGVPYVTIGNSGVTTAERALTAGVGIAIADAGPNASVVVSCTVGGVDIVDIPFVTTQAVAGLNAERILTAGSGIVVTDSGQGLPITIRCNWGAVPSTIEPDDAAAPGTGVTVARIDHVHAIVAAVAGTIEPDDAAAEGAATSFSRSDHQHAIVAAVPVDIANANAEGAATSFARSDHVHNHPAALGVDLHHTEVHVVNSTGPHAEAGLTIGHVLRASGAAAFSFAALVAGDLPNLGGVPALTFGLANAAGAAATYVQTDASLAIFDAVVPGTIQPDDAAAAGVVAFAARRDHQHAIVCAAAASPSVDLNASVEGTAYDFARSDHTHQLDQGIAPTWTQLHTFNLGLTVAAAQAITMGDGATIGQVAGPLITFDDTLNYLEIMGCNVGIGTATPSQELDLIGDLELENTISADTGVIYKGADRFIHNFQHPTGGGAVPVGRNTFVGVNAGNFTMGSTATGTAHGSYNTAVGYKALLANTTGYSNTAVGNEALDANTTGYSNMAVGYRALTANTTGHENMAIGQTALAANTTGVRNVAMGQRALLKNEDGGYNIALGRSASERCTSGSDNIAAGANALFYNRSGSDNVAIGRSAGTGAHEVSDISENVLLGYGAGLGLRTGGDGNILVGYQAGDNVAAGANNIVVGYDIDAPLAAGSNQLSIGNLIFGTSLDGTGTNISSGNVGFGTNAPDRRSHTEVVDAVTNAVTYAQRLSHITSGTAVAGFGTGIEFELEENDASNKVAAIIEALWTDAGEGANADADLVFKVMLNDGAAAEQFRIASDGGLFAQTLLQQSAVGLVVEYDVGTKELYAETSARAFKENVRPLAMDTAEIFNLSPRRWIDKATGREEFGLIAEEVAEILPALVVYGPSGPVGVKYHKLAILLLEEVKRQRDRLH